MRVCLHVPRRRRCPLMHVCSSAGPAASWPPAHKAHAYPPRTLPNTARPAAPAVHVHDGITTLVGNGVATALTLAPIKAGGATIIPIDTVLQYITMASSANSRRNLLSTRHLLCSCGGLSGCESAQRGGCARAWRAWLVPAC